MTQFHTHISKTHSGLPRDIFPECTEPTAVVGHLSREASDLTGLPVSAETAAGGGDLTMMAVGNGMVRNGDGITQPIPQNVAVYEEYYQIFRDTFPQFSRNLQKLTNLGRNAK